jgi:hypothetical protein
MLALADQLVRIEQLLDRDLHIVANDASRHVSFGPFAEVKKS